MAKKTENPVSVKILLGVSGGISAYKAVDLASKLTSAGMNVRTVMTESACKLVTPKSFEAVTGESVFTTLWNESEDFKIGHVHLVDWADIVAVVPATANIIGKIANGICDEILSTVLCVCWSKPTLLAPAMNNQMWSNPAVQRNIQTVKKMGFKIIGPETGRLACGVEGVGRMSEPENIFKEIVKIASQIKGGKKS